MQLIPYAGPINDATIFAEDGGRVWLCTALWGNMRQQRRRYRPCNDPGTGNRGNGYWTI